MIKKFLNIKTSDKGFTLIELLIFIGIFTILITSLFELLITVFDVQLESQSTSVVSQDGRYILNKLAHDIKNATSVTTPIAGSQSATLVISDGTTTYTYALSGNNLTLNNSTLGATDQLNSINTTVSNLSFLTLTNINADKLRNFYTVSVSFTLNSVALKRSGEASKTYNLTVGTR